jgi:hypothetical protein
VENSSPRFWSASGIKKKSAQSKQSPNGQKLTPSGHPGLDAEEPQVPRSFF